MIDAGSKMSAAMHDAASQHNDLASRKRHSLHTDLQIPNKRPRAANSVQLSQPAALSPSTKVNQAGRFKAEKWFEDTNKNASRDVQFTDNDPPFYIERQSPAKVDSTCAMQSEDSSPRISKFGKPTAPTRSLLAQMDSSGSNSDDYRSVIDDLTIQNKKLKKQLRQYQKLHCAHLQEEKLFEVRVHSLTAHRKRELEQTLRDFASSIHESSSERFNTDSLPARHPVAAPMPKATVPSAVVDGTFSAGIRTDLRKPSSASTSHSKHMDSAYASMSGNTGPSQRQPHDTGRLENATQTSQRQQHVNSYLHNIPESLVPPNSSLMSERAKSRLVVKRLEQIFTGKGIASHRHPHSYQQQEVAHIAAQADKGQSEFVSRGRGAVKEGVREARILPGDTELQVESVAEVTQVAQRSRQSSNDGGASARGGELSRDGSPDQRPTRPLDLDLSRPQVPADNVDYIRHLGLTSPRAGLDDEGSASDGWVYLNLLISMAQLHTLNVTPEFIRRAITDVSTKFELSSDGTTVRWLGGLEGTKLSSDSDDISSLGSSNLYDSTIAAGQQSTASKHNKFELKERQKFHADLPMQIGTSANESDTDHIQAQIPHQTANSDANFHYKPLFCHQSPSDDDDDDNSGGASESSLSSDVMENATGLISGINSGSYGVRETEVKLRKHNSENGPIIFYHKARFCTDFSGDPSGAVMEDGTYRRYTQDPIGCPPDTSGESDVCNERSDTIVENSSNELKLDQSIISALDLYDLQSCISTIDNSRSLGLQSPLSMGVSGLGGVHPDDNFVIKVQRRHCRRPKDVALYTSGPHDGMATVSGGKSQRLGFREILSRSSARSPAQKPFESDIISETKMILEPSSLPSPSFACLPFSTSSSETSGDDELQDILETNDSNGKSVVWPEPTGSAKFSTEDISRDPERHSSAPTSSDDSDDDSSIDLLAHARVLDPDTVAAREREFEINTAQPFDSVAATAGESSSGPPRPVEMMSDAGSMDVDWYGSDGIYDSD